ncbi:MAG: type II secretion system F family protein [Candidatus Limnocylindria bacterium]
MTVAFRYRAARSDGKVIGGVVESPTPTEASRRLTERGLHPLSLEPTTVAERSVRAAPRRELAAVFQGLASLVGAGVPVLRAIEATRATAGARLRDGLAAAANQVREGRSLGEALGGLQGLVPNVVVGIVRAGERASRLAPALDEAATHLELEADLESSVQQALAYPLILLVAGLASTGVIATVVVPRFAAILADLGHELPPSTRLLLATSAFVGHWWWALLVAGALLAGLIARAMGDPENRRRVADFLLGVPLLGGVRLSLATARASRAAASALSAGVPLLRALGAAGEAAGDPAVRQRLARASTDVSEGAALAPALERHKALLPSALQLVAVGEASGQLGPMFRRAGALAGQEAERRLRTLVGLLEPGLVVFFGGLVAFVAAALLQAVYSLRP